MCLLVKLKTVFFKKLSLISVKTIFKIHPTICVQVLRQKLEFVEQKGKIKYQRKEAKELEELNTEIL